MAYSRSYPFVQISYSWNSKRKKQELFYSITVVIWFYLGWKYV